MTPFGSSQQPFVPGLVDAFGRRYGHSTKQVLVAVAPGRVNLIGEHTDYNDGWVLPMAIDRSVGLAFAERDDQRIRITSTSFGEECCISIEDLQRGLARESGFAAYVAAVASQLEQAGIRLRGIDAVVDGDLPMACGLSSSAALELATARALCAAAEVPWKPLEMAQLCVRAENEGVGVACGAMDQMACALGSPDHALLLDCRSFAFESVAIPKSAGIVVLDSGVRRTLTESAFNQRRESCERAVAVLQKSNPEIRALRDATLGDLEQVQQELDRVTFAHAQHVVAECRRPQQMASALGEGRLAEAGSLMNDSHRSLRDLYGVSCPELDLITDLARRHPRCFGARLTGAGFGGCAVALVEAGEEESVSAHVNAEYCSVHSAPFNAFAVRASAGTRLLE